MTTHAEDRKHPTARDLRVIAAAEAYKAKHRGWEAITDEPIADEMWRHKRVT